MVVSKVLDQKWSEGNTVTSEPKVVFSKFRLNPYFFVDCRRVCIWSRDRVYMDPRDLVWLVDPGYFVMGICRSPAVPRRAMDGVGSAGLPLWLRVYVLDVDFL